MGLAGEKQRPMRRSEHGESGCGLGKRILTNGGVKLRNLRALVPDEGLNDSSRNACFLEQ